MSEKWKPTEEQNCGPVSRVSEFFIDELNELPKGASEVMMDWTKKFEELLEEKR